MSTDSFGGAGMVGEDFISEITTFKKKKLELAYYFPFLVAL